MKGAYVAVAIIGIIAISLLASTAFAANFVAGDTVEVQNTGTSGLKVRSSPCGYWNGITKKFNGEQGHILSGPIYKYCSGYTYTWWEIRWSDGREGWSADGGEGKAWLTKVFITPSTKFSLNDRVKASNLGGSNLIIRSEPPELANIGSVSEGTEGTVVAGPFYGVPKGKSGFWHFWKINFGSITGWAAEDFLQKSDSPNPNADYPGARWVVNGHTNGAQTANRGAAEINYVIIHATDSVGNSDKGWFRSGTAAHYLVKRNGTILQFVHDKDIAYHAGNFAYNEQSIGVEHEGHVNDISGFTEAQYQASAELVKWLMNRYGIPASHLIGVAPVNPDSSTGIIGHNQVPDPDNPDIGGGASHHTDPGSYWDWNGYMARLTATAPSPPQNLVATAGNTRVDLSWSPPASDGGSPVTSYKIYRGTSPDGETFYASTASLSFADTGVTNGVTYYYKATAVNAAGEGTKSDVASAKPQDSTVLNPPVLQSPEDGTTVPTITPTFTWASDPNADYHALYIEQQSPDGVWGLLYSSEIYDGPIYGNSFLFPSGFLQNGSSYRWQMGSNNDGLWSGTTSFWYFTVIIPPIRPPSAPQNLQATEGDSKVELSWDPPADDGGYPIALYFIYRGTDLSQYIPFLNLVDGSVRTYTDTSVTNGVTYYYQVSAVTSPGRNIEGARSVIAEATPRTAAATVPSPPQNLDATAGDGYVDLSWLPPASDGGSSLTQYRVYKGTSPGSEALAYFTTIGPSPSLRDTAVSNGVTYYYKVTAVNSVGESDFSNEDSATPQAPTYNTAFLTDAQLTDYNSMSEAQIRTFLSSYNSYFRQKVKDVDGVWFDAAAVISRAARDYRINPKVILTTLQKESEGVTISTRPSNTRMRNLMGCGSPSTARGQLRCAARLFRSYHDDLTNKGSTISGWQVGVPKTTLDGVTVTPATKAVAGQFTYTPLAGVQWGGNDPRWGGVYLFYYWWNKFAF